MAVSFSGKCSIAPKGWSSLESDKESTEKENKRPRRKHLPLSLQKDNDRSESRFKSVSHEELSTLAAHNPPQNTKASTSWAVRNLHEWFKWHNSSEGAEQCPNEFLESSCRPEVLNKWLQVYVAETRNKIGNAYPPKRCILCYVEYCDIQCMTTQNVEYPNFLEKKSVHFVDFHRCIDNLFRKLHDEGIGSESRHTPSISIEEDNCLWEKGILNLDTPQGLLNAVLYYNGKNFVLRGGQEHRDLKFSQLTQLRNPDCYMYVEKSSKNRGGGLGQLHLEHKKVPVYASSSVGSRCRVRILDTYISKLPSGAKEKHLFYCKPLSKPSPYGPWFCCQPCGKKHFE